jgi:hypothetical protein
MFTTPGPGTPVANDDFTATDGTNPVVVNVLANDSAPSGINSASVALQGVPQHGSAAVRSDGQITYTASASFTGTDTFSYTMADTNGVRSNVAKVTVVVNGPKANDDDIDTDAGNPVTINVLANDTDPGGPGKLNPSTVTVVRAAVHGGTQVNADGTITYTPQDAFSGTDTFQYTVKDVNGATSNPGLVTVVVNRPTANDDFAQTNANQAVTIQVLANDTDPDGPNKLNPASVALVAHSGPSNGTARINADGSITYTPNSGFFGTDGFQYTVKDVNNATSNPARVSITVVNAGSLNDDSIDTDAGNPVNIPVLANDSSPNGFKVNTVAVPTAPAHGSTAVQSDGSITYTPVDGFAGTDTFTYTVQNGAGVNLGPAKVTVVVNRPTANDDFTDTDAGNPVTINVLANDTDPDGPNKLNPSTVTLASTPGHGSATVNADGTITYTPVDGFSGSDFFTYTVKDVNNATSNPARVNVVVNRPTANDDSIDTDGTNPVTVNVLANDTDPDGPNKLDPTTVKLVAGNGPAHGTAVVNADGTITYTAVMGFAGTDTFQYTVKDVNKATSNPATVSVVVNRPTAEDDFASTRGTTPVTVNVLANDSDPDGPGKIDPGSVTVVTAPAHGTTKVNADGTVTYTPAAGFSGIDTFGYTVKDFPGATSNVATVHVDVNPPTANPVSATTVGTTPVAIPVLASDVAVDGPAGFGPGSVTLVTGPRHGRVNVNPSTGLIAYTATPGFFGTDTFTYEVTDVHGSPSDPATVTVNVTHAPRPTVRHGKHAGRSPVVVFVNPLTGAQFTLTPYGSHYHGGIRLAVGDVNGNGTFDVITAAAHGHHALHVYDGLTGALLAGPLGTLRPTGANRADGVRVASADVNGDGFDDVIVRLGSGRHARFEVFSGATGAPITGLSAAQLDQFFAAHG